MRFWWGMSLTVWPCVWRPEEGNTDRRRHYPAWEARLVRTRIELSRRGYSAKDLCFVDLHSQLQFRLCLPHDAFLKAREFVEGGRHAPEWPNYKLLRWKSIEQLCCGAVPKFNLRTRAAIFYDTLLNTAAPTACSVESNPSFRSGRRASMWVQLNQSGVEKHRKPITSSALR